MMSEKSLDFFFKPEEETRLRDLAHLPMGPILLLPASNPHSSRLHVVATCPGGSVRRGSSLGRWKEVVEAAVVHYEVTLFTVAQVKSVTSYQFQFQFSSGKNTGKREGKMDHFSCKPELGFIMGPIAQLLLQRHETSRVDHISSLTPLPLITSNGLKEWSENHNLNVTWLINRSKIFVYVVKISQTVGCIAYQFG